MKSVLRLILVFVVISITTLILTEGFGVRLESLNYWDRHGLVFLLAIATFPRLTLLFSSVPFGGLVWWAGFFFAPRILVAVLATITYWNQNPLLVVAAWLVAMGGESSEKMIVINRSRKGWSDRQSRGFENAKEVKVEIEK